MRRILCIALAVLAVVSAASPAYAGCGIFGRRAARQAARRAYAAPCSTGYGYQSTTVYQAATVSYTSSPTLLPAPPAYAVPATPQAPAKTLPTPQGYAPAPPLPAPGVSGIDAALGILNGARMARGLAPLPFDATLAAYASTNTGVHAPGSSGGGSQCWAGVNDPVAAARMWLNSPSHYAIVMSATTGLGLAASPSGMTLNSR